MKIFKYPLMPEDRQALLIPKGATLLSVAPDVHMDDNLCLWALVDPDARPETRTIRIHGTGHEVPKPENLRFIGTAVMRSISLVWHVFEEV